MEAAMEIAMKTMMTMMMNIQATKLSKKQRTLEQHDSCVSIQSPQLSEIGASTPVPRPEKLSSHGQTESTEAPTLKTAMDLKSVHRKPAERRKPAAASATPKYSLRNGQLLLTRTPTSSKTKRQSGCEAACNDFCFACQLTA